MGVLVSIHLMEAYSDGGHTARKPGRLSRSNEARAKELLCSKIDGDISIAEIADACGLSRSYFIVAFRETTGLTPYQWVLSLRVARAREMLADADLTLAEIALRCGCADQSHFTRVFTRAFGTSPGRSRGGLPHKA